jgi:hypothetical protein
MTKTDLQTALDKGTQTDKRTAGVFLDTLSALAYKEIKKAANLSCPVLASWWSHCQLLAARQRGQWRLPQEWGAQSHKSLSLQQK